MQIVGIKLGSCTHHQLLQVHRKNQSHRLSWLSLSKPVVLLNHCDLSAYSSSRLCRGKGELAGYVLATLTVCHTRALPSSPSVLKCMCWVSCQVALLRILEDLNIYPLSRIHGGTQVSECHARGNPDHLLKQCLQTILHILARNTGDIKAHITVVGTHQSEGRKGSLLGSRCTCSFESLRLGWYSVPSHSRCLRSGSALTIVPSTAGMGAMGSARKVRPCGRWAPSPRLSHVS